MMTGTLGGTTKMRAFGTQRLSAEREPVRDRTGLAELNAVRRTLKARFGDGANALVRFFASADADASGCLSHAELVQGLSSLGVSLPRRSWESLCAEFDSNGDGTVSEAEFLRAVVGAMRPQRERLVRDAFAVLAGRGHRVHGSAAEVPAGPIAGPGMGNKGGKVRADEGNSTAQAVGFGESLPFDPRAAANNGDYNGNHSNGDGNNNIENDCNNNGGGACVDVDGRAALALEAVLAAYDPSGHPDVIRGVRDVRELRAQMRETFATVGDGDAWITEDEFVEYHANMSCGIFDEAGFTNFVTTAWGIDKAAMRLELTAKWGIVDDPRNPYLPQTRYGGAMPRDY